MMRLGSGCWGLVVVMLAALPVAGQTVELEKAEDGIEVRVDGQLFTRYLFKSGAKPILWPVIGPTGKEMTRAWPMRENTEETKDHVHQRSFWFTHGDVNGVSFWHEMDRHGTIAHREVLRAETDNNRVVIATRNDWLGPDGQKMCEDIRTLTFSASPDRRTIDFDITIQAGDQPVTFGDTKEGTFGIRTADSMRVDLKQGGKIVNSEGLTDEQAWGKRAAWVDYTGPVEGETLGIAILNHPSSFRFPTFWHVRTYGLFAANPFGVRDFTGEENANGSYELKPGESFSLSYRVILHCGDTSAAKIEEAFEQYSKETTDK